jgi:uncharacterized membrane protein
VGLADALPSALCRLPVCRSVIMLETIAVILFLLWALGMVTSYTMGGLIHLLLLLMLIVVVVRVLQGRRI